MIQHIPCPERCSSTAVRSLMRLQISQRLFCEAGKHFAQFSKQSCANGGFAHVNIKASAGKAQADMRAGFATRRQLTSMTELRL